MNITPDLHKVPIDDAESRPAAEIQIREAQRDDLPAIVTLLTNDPLGATRERSGLPLAPEYEKAFAEMEFQSGNMLIIAAKGRVVVGCLQLTIIAGLSRLGAKRGQIEGVRVAVDHRGAGIGECLVRHAVARARALDCSMVQLTTDVSRKDALAFYMRIGFQPSHVGLKLALTG